jgi:thiol:disulfide interchange protein DsbA
VDRKIKRGTMDELADLYASLGIDRTALLATAKSFAVNAQIARNQKAVTRWAIEVTPTFVVAGRYRATATADRGHEGLLHTVEHLIARERAAAGTSAAR